MPLLCPSRVSSFGMPNHAGVLMTDAPRLNAHEAVEKAILADIEKALLQSCDNIVGELPKGQNSSLAGTLHVERKGRTFEIWTDTPVWEWINDGTGIYNPTHRGAGPMGQIVPVNVTLRGDVAKTLHFKNAQLAAVLGFPTEDVFLKSVKGIRPRYYFEKHFESGEFIDVLMQV